MKTILPAVALAVLSTSAFANNVDFSQDNKVKFKISGKVAPTCIVSQKAREDQKTLDLSDSGRQHIQILNVWCNVVNSAAKAKITSKNGGYLVNTQHVDEHESHSKVAYKLNVSGAGNFDNQELDQPLDLSLKSDFEDYGSDNTFSVHVAPNDYILAGTYTDVIKVKVNPN
ncbi:hypothetical protein N9R79_04360 [Vibrio sp.]|nr:hypothetical protein [Vibrio sp.]